jgi:hypothetical protein
MTQRTARINSTNFFAGLCVSASLRDVFCRWPIFSQVQRLWASACAASKNLELLIIIHAEAV